MGDGSVKTGVTRCGAAVPCRSLLALAILLGSGAAHATHPTVPQLRIVRAVLYDDGDHDGWADTRESLSMRVLVRNVTGMDLTGLELVATTDSPTISALTDNRILVGDLADGASVLAEDSFTFVVRAQTDRFSLTEELTATFRFTSWSDQHDFGEFDLEPLELTIDLDLDAFGGAGPTTFFESFESGFGQFTTMHLDASLNPPPGSLGNHALGVAAADGWRCQYSDPDWENALSHNNAQGTQCYPSPNGAPDTYYWHLAPERAFHGLQALHYGVFLDASRLYTTPTAQLEAIRTTQPISLGWSNVCSITTTQPCAAVYDCPAGEECLPAAPTFTFKHQISLVDERVLGDPASANRGIVAAQLAAADGTPIGPWIRLEPHVNVHDTQANASYTNCTFDPTDDGNDEDDFFDPTDPLRSLGPSSMCFPNYNLTFQGSTVQQNVALLGKASDGPGLLGVKGLGTWVQPSYDLSRFRGRRVRLRFLTSGLKAASVVLWGDGFVDNTTSPDPRDDGWFIDDVRMTHVLETPATVAPDGKDNEQLPGLEDPDDDGAFPDNCPFVSNASQADADGDGRGDACDACAFDPYDDLDGDGLCLNVDNCGRDANPQQADFDGDGTGDACDACTDVDADGFGDAGFPGNVCPPDNCPDAANVAQADYDADGAGDVCDCGPGHPQTHPGAIEINDGLDNQCAGDPGYGLVDELTAEVVADGPQSFAWPAQSGATQYQVARAPRADFAAGCMVWITALPAWTDAAKPPRGFVFFYLFRAVEPHDGSWGATSAGVERAPLCARGN